MSQPWDSNPRPTIYETATLPAELGWLVANAMIGLLSAERLRGIAQKKDFAKGEIFFLRGERPSGDEFLAAG